MNKLTTLDYAVFLLYFIAVSAYGVWVYNRKKKTEASTTDFFLAEGSLTWWAIGASLIASNISAEQFIGMSGQGFTVGLAVAAFEWIAAVALIIVAVFFMPIYLKNRIYTMPQFLKERYNETVALIMAIFWLFLYVLVNLTSILYLGAKPISNLMGTTSMAPVIIGLAVFASVITLGGMKVIGFTDVIQVVVLIIGGLVVTYLALVAVAEHFELGSSALVGFKELMSRADDHFHLIFPKPDPSTGPSPEIDRYLLLPGITMYFAGQWIANLNYWGCNQYITQRALGADLHTARTGILFAGLLKLLMPVIVMLPGIAAYVLYKEGQLQAEMTGEGGKVLADNAYGAVLTFLPSGLKGLSVAALTAAIVASLAGKANSIATIFTLDIYKPYLDQSASEKKLVWTGRVVIMIAMVIAVFLAANDESFLNIGGEGGFAFIQKYTGYVSPGIFATFLLGMFWKRTTGAAAVAGVLLGFLLSVFFDRFAVPMLGNETILYTAFPTEGGKFVIPYMVCMGWSFAFTVVAMIAISMAGPKDNPKAFVIDKQMFKITPSTTALIVVTMLILSALYVKFW
jgi:SSS family solute:Na+ symporter